MRIDLDPILQIVKPWELIIAIDGVDHAARRLTNADVKRLGDAAKYSDPDNQKFIAGIFPDSDPATVSAWDNSQASTVLAAVMVYYQETVTRKNVEAVTTAVAAMTRAGSTR